MKLQILDADYKMVNSQPVVRIFGKEEDGTPVCVFDDDFSPYFYCLPRDTNGAKEEIRELLEEKFQGEVQKIKEVEKYMPMGYDPKKKKILKIVLQNPSRVPAMREYLGGKKPVKKLYETDILYKYRYLSDKRAGGMQWIEVEGKTRTTETVDCKAIEADEMKPIERKENQDLRYFSFDIECIPEEEDRVVDSEKDPIILISCAFEPAYKGDKSLVLVAKPGNTDGLHFGNEKEMLEKFLEILEKYDPDIITGYNVEDFDLSYLLTRLDKHDLSKSLGRCEKQAYANKYGNRTDVTIVGRAVIDPYRILKRDPYKRFMRYDLDTVSEKLLGEGKEDVEYDEMKELWNSDNDDLQRFVDYSRKDAELPLHLIIKKGLLEKFFELSRISGILLQDSTGGQTQRISNYLLTEFNKRDFLLPSKPSDEEVKKRKKRREKKALKGGLVLEPEKGLHTDSCISVLDFKSLYPSIMSTYNICPTTLVQGGTDEEVDESPNGEKFVKRGARKGVLPRIVEKLIDTRSEVKKKMRETEDDEEESRFNARQLALKDMTNSFYGYTGYSRTRLYRLEIANAITAYGRKTIERTKKLVKENYDLETVYGDTDSVMVDSETKNLDKAYEVSKKMSQFITDELPRRLVLEPEKIYRSFLILTKKRYAGWAFEKTNGDWEEDIDMKGIETVRRDWCRLVSDTMEEVIDIILKQGDINKAIDFVQEKIEKLSKGEVPLEDLAVVKSITKKIENYDGKLPHIELAKKMKKRDPSNAPTPGERLPYIIIKGNRMVSKRVEHPDYIKESDLEVDPDYYIHSQLLPPLERIFNVIGVDKQELLGDGRQATMDEIVNGGRVNRNRDVSVKKDPRETLIKELNGFQCKECGKEFRRAPLKGKCECGGEIYGVGNGSIGKKVKLNA